MLYPSFNLPLFLFELQLSRVSFPFRLFLRAISVDNGGQVPDAQAQSFPHGVELVLKNPPHEILEQAKLFKLGAVMQLSAFRQVLSPDAAEDALDSSAGWSSPVGRGTSTVMIGGGGGGGGGGALPAAAVPTTGDGSGPSAPPAGATTASANPNPYGGGSTNLPASLLLDFTSPIVKLKDAPTTSAGATAFVPCPLPQRGGDGGGENGGGSGAGGAVGVQPEVRSVAARSVGALARHAVVRG